MEISWKLVLIQEVDIQRYYTVVIGLDNQNTVLPKLRSVELEILDVVEQVCRENGLRFSLMYGTLLGAVRHKGFIPWDDDIDIVMPREDLDRLIEIWPRCAPKNYILQSRDMEKDYPSNFIKIRKDHTTFLEWEKEKKSNHHKGIFIDIFPAERLAPDGLKRKSQFMLCLMNLLLTRGYTSGDKGIMGATEKIILCLPAGMKESIRKKTGAAIQHWNDREDLPYFIPVTVKDCGRAYPPDLFDNLVPMRFEDREYFAVKDYDTVLRTRYGDYMTLPPESERTWKHHPLIIDFEKNYEEL